MRLQVVSVPYRYDEFGEGLGAGPQTLLEAGLLDHLREAGFEVGDERESHLPDEEREAGRTAVNIGRLGAKTAALVTEARQSGAATIILAGDDTACIGVVSGLQASDGAATPIGLIWLDAHGDFNTPETSYSGILAGMPMAILAGLAGPLWRGAAGLAVPVPTDRMVIAGARQLDEKEETLLRSTEVQVLTTNDVRKGEPFARAVRSLADRCSMLFLHLDLDILDPRLIPSSSTPAERGLEIDEVVTTISTVLASGKVAAFCIAGLNPGAGNRGQRSLASTMEILERSVTAWKAIPPLPANVGN